MRTLGKTVLAATVTAVGTLTSLLAAAGPAQAVPQTATGNYTIYWRSFVNSSPMTLSCSAQYGCSVQSGDGHIGNSYVDWAVLGSGGIVFNVHQNTDPASTVLGYGIGSPSGQDWYGDLCDNYDQAANVCNAWTDFTMVKVS